MQALIDFKSSYPQLRMRWMPALSSLIACCLRLFWPSSSAILVATSSARSCRLALKAAVASQKWMQTIRPTHLAPVFPCPSGLALRTLRESDSHLLMRLQVACLILALPR